MEAPKQPKVTTTLEKARPKKPDLQSTAGTKPATRKQKKKAAATVKTASDKTTTSDLVVSTQI
jgi:hypothetical protein